MHHFIRSCANTSQAASPEFKAHNARKTLWLINGDFEVNKRDELRLKIEALSADWKTSPDRAEYQSIIDSEFEGEVEFVDSP